MKTKSKNLLLVILLIAVIGMAVGYAALSQQLVIKGTANITTEWEVEVKSITPASTNASTGAKDKVSPTFTATTASFDVNLAYPGATAVYVIKVENSGTINARLASISGIQEANAQEPTGITYSINAKENDFLASKETKEYTVTVVWDANATEIPDAKGKTATITLNYVQAE